MLVLVSIPPTMESLSSSAYHLSLRNAVEISSNLLHDLLKMERSESEPYDKIIRKRLIPQKQIRKSVRMKQKDTKQNSKKK
jgi:hypothetical protein